MSLFRQIVQIVIVVQLVTLMSVVYENFHSMNEQIRGRLLSDAQDTATSLGLSISMVAGSPQSLSRIQTMIDAIFDSGYYSAIELKDVQGTLIYEKHNPPVVFSVPQWFVDYVRFEAPVARSQIMVGWQQYGTLYIRNHNGHAYLQMWDILVSLLETFSIIFTLTVLGLFLLLRLILRPLKKVRMQAEAILHDDFPINEEVPSTTELQEVTRAMNAMVIKVREIFRREADALKRSRELLCYDQEFGVANRHFFMNQLTAYLDHKEEDAYGVIVLIKMMQIDEIKNRYGYERYSTFVRALFAELEALASPVSEHALVARFTPGSFALLLPGRKQTTQMAQLGDRVTLLIERVAHSQFNQKEPCVFAVGISSYSADMDRKTVMSHVDYALLEAEALEQNSYHIYKDQNLLESLLLQGRERWVQAITEAIAAHRLEVMSQRCMQVQEGALFHKELLTRMRTEEGTTLGANFFLPIAKYAKQLEKIDRYLFEQVQHITGETVAINLSLESIRSSHFMALLQEHANRLALQRLKPNIHFEINMNAIDGHMESTAFFAKALKRLGYTFGIDHFIFSPQSVDLIEAISPSYLKVNILQFEEYAQNSEFNMMQSIHNIASSYGMKIIATEVESEQQKMFLNKIGIDLIQGRYIEEAKPLEERG